MVACVSQVDKDFVSPLEEASSSSALLGGKRKRDDDETEQEVKRAVADRQRCWLQRSSGGKPAGWRARVVPRRAAYRWLLAMDNVIRQHSDLPGLRHFSGPSSQDLKENRFPDPLTWPHLSVSVDRGSDGVAALHYLQRKLRANVEPMWDSSHDSWRDFLRMLRENSLMPYWYVFLISVNVLHGPFLEHSRFNAM